MNILEIDSFKDFAIFDKVRDDIHANFPDSIKPISHNLRDVFSPQKNKSFQNGECKAWIVQKEGKWKGRIVAFYNKNYFNVGDEQKTGGIGFFECVNDNKVAQLLFDKAKHWLSSKGYQAMDGPINFGSKLVWWGLVVEGEKDMPFTLSYYPNYYKQLFESYGFQNFYEQYCFTISPHLFNIDRFLLIAQRVQKQTNLQVKTFDKKKITDFAKDFCMIYNKAWVQAHGEEQLLEVKEVVKYFTTVSLFIDPDIIFLLYHNDQPISFIIFLPELNDYFKYCKGKMGILQLFNIFFRKTFFPTKKINGLIYGTIPEFHGKGVETLIYFKLFEVCKRKKYKELELIWIGDFNPNMIGIAQKIGFKQSRKLITYRYLFDRNKPFKRHPNIIM